MYAIDMLYDQLNYADSYKKMREYDEEDVNSFTENPKRKFTETEMEENMERKAINAMDSLTCEISNGIDNNTNTSKRRKFTVEQENKHVVKDQIQTVRKNLSKRSRDDSDDCSSGTNDAINHNPTNDHDNTYESANEIRGKRKRLEQVYNGSV